LAVVLFVFELGSKNKKSFIYLTEIIEYPPIFLDVDPTTLSGTVNSK